MGSKSGQAHALGCPECDPGVMGHEGMFWGCCGGFCVPVFQYIQYIQILIIYLHIHAYKCLFLYIHAYTCIYLSNTQQEGGHIPTAVSYLQDTSRFLQIHVYINIYLLPK